jgi:photosystem II stability/assembly factor-like uncharacterized protein
MRPTKLSVYVSFIVLALSSSLNAQNWVLTSAPNTNWSAVACSADGRKLVATVNAGLIYTSPDFGVTWFPTPAPATNWSSVASSSDGSKLVAVAGRKDFYSPDTGWGLIYVSGDSGATWSQTAAPSNSWSSVASSSDGTRLVAVAFTGDIFISSDSGTTWVSNNIPYQAWNSVFASADGLTMIVGSSGQLFRSDGSGITWIPVGDPGLYCGYWRSVAGSAQASKLIVGAGECSVNHCLEPVPIFLSENGAYSWSRNSAFTPVCNGWGSVASSADGSRLAAVELWGGRFHTSIDFGSTWTSNTVPFVIWSGGSIASSADGTRLVAAIDFQPPSGGAIYTLQTPPSRPSLNIAQSGQEIILSWTVPSTPFALEQRTNFLTGNWSAVAESPVLNNNNLQYTVTVPLASGGTFYRLRSE